MDPSTCHFDYSQFPEEDAYEGAMRTSELSLGISGSQPHNTVSHYNNLPLLRPLLRLSETSSSTQSSRTHSNSSSLVGNSDNGSTQAFRLPSPLVLQALTLQSIFSVVLVMSRLLQLVSPPSSLLFVTSIWIEICLVSSLFGA